MSTHHVPFLDLRAVNSRFDSDFADALKRAMTNSQWILGPEVEAFESEFAAYCDCTYAIGVANGLEAIELVLRAWNIGVGDEVIVPSNTFIATWLAVSMVGATPVPVDPDDATCNVEARSVEAALTPRTRAVIAVHLYGRPAAMDGIVSVAQRAGIQVLEDAAQAHGARWHGRRTGSLGHAAAFSFYPAKNLGTLGDGGAVTTNDPLLAQRLRLLRNYGSQQRYVHECIGRNSRLDELQAAFLRIKLPHLDEDNRRRAEIAERYGRELSGLPGLQLPPQDTPHSQSSWHLYVVRHPKRDTLAELLEIEGVSTLVHYPVPPGDQAAYTSHATGLHSSAAAALGRQSLSLPIGPTMNDDQVTTVVKAVRHAAPRLAE